LQQRPVGLEIVDALLAQDQADRLAEYEAQEA